MAEQNFSWLTESTLEALPVNPTADNRKMPNLLQLKEKAFHHKRVLIAASVLLTVLLLLKLTQRGETKAPQRMEGMAALLPIPKGQIVEGMLLRPVTILPSVLSKAQKIQRVLPADAEKIMGKVRAKKDIPPHKPLFWTDLELIPASKLSTKVPIPTVSYPEKKL